MWPRSSAAVSTPGLHPIQQQQQQMMRLMMLTLILVTLTDASSSSSDASSRDRVVYWNSSNPLFQPEGENLLLVSLQDRINLVCPANDIEYYKIYWTPQQAQAQACSGGTFLFSCRQMPSYWVYAQIFPADPTAPGFLNPVYFYTPSTGDVLGLDQTSGGACQYRNMRVKVVAVAATPRPDSATTTSSSSRSSNLASASSAGDVTVGGDSAATYASGATGQPEWKTTATGASDRAAAAPTEATATGRGSSQTTARDPERIDFARINLITGATVAMPTSATVVALTCCCLAVTAWLSL